MVVWIRFLMHTLPAVRMIIIGILIFGCRWIIETWSRFLWISIGLVMVIGNIFVIVLIVEFVVIFVLFGNGVGECVLVFIRIAV